MLGGFLNRNAQADANAANAAAADRNIQLQKEFAQSGIQWKVADAEKAGVHPLYALGAPTSSFSPVSIGAQPESGVATGLAQAGQDVSRAIHSTRSATQRTDAVTQTANALTLKNMELRNQLLSVQIAKLGADQVGPPMPTTGDNNYAIPGQTSTYGIKPKPLETAPGDISTPSQEAGSVTDRGHSQTGTGYAPYPSKDLKERIEDVLPYELEHFYRNRILPSLGQRLQAPFPAPPGKDWWWNTAFQEYQLYPHGERPRMGHKVK